MSKQTKQNKENNKAVSRPPIVVVMGHIDHGKTKILDWYRKTKVVEEEAGGITQHIGAYEAEHKGRKITFIDTPGHEAFSKLRSRGARAADLAILVISAEEGVKPQTKEAIGIIAENNLPFVVALNKIDRPEANPERVKQELARENVLVESYGGKIPDVAVSAKIGTNMDELLETILLLAELENLSADVSREGEGVVIEAHLDSRRGITASLLVADGTLKKGETALIGRNAEGVKILEDFRGRPIEEAYPSMPVLVSGLEKMPTVGEKFYSFADKRDALDFLSSLPQEEAKTSAAAEAKDQMKPIFNIIIKADVVGSKEALEESLKKLENEAVGINVLKSGVGDINETDVKLAASTKLVTIVGFKVKIDRAAKNIAEGANIRVVSGNIIYDLIDEVKKQAAEIIPPEIKRTFLGRAKILKIFRKDGNKMVIGGKVEEGEIKIRAVMEIKRAKESAGRGTILNLQQNKRDVEEASRGMEFGAMIETSAAVEEGNTAEIFSEETIKRAL